MKRCLLLPAEQTFVKPCLLLPAELGEEQNLKASFHNDLKSISDEFIRKLTPCMLLPDQSISQSYAEFILKSNRLIEIYNNQAAARQAPDAPVAGQAASR